MTQENGTASFLEQEEKPSNIIARIGDLGVQLLNTKEPYEAQLYWGHLLLAKLEVSQQNGLRVTQQEVHDKVIMALSKLYLSLSRLEAKAGKSGFFPESEFRVMVILEKVIGHVLAWQKLALMTKAIEKEANGRGSNKVFFCRMDKVGSERNILEQELFVKDIYVPEGTNLASLVPALKEEARVEGYEFTGIGIMNLDFSYELTYEQYISFLTTGE